MAALLSRRVRRTPPLPGEALDIDWSNPITAGLSAALVHADAAYGVCLGLNAQNVIAFSGGTQANTPTAPGARATGNAQIYTFPSSGTLTSPNYSLFAVGSCTSASVTQSALDMDNGTTRYFQFRFVNGKVDFIPFNTSGSVTGEATSPVALSVSEMSRGFTMGATASPTRTAAFQNGVVTVGSTPSSMITPGTVLPVYVGSRVTGTQAWLTGGLSLVATWMRTLSDGEMESLNDNPWQLFKPPKRRLWLAYSSSSNATATITGVASTSAAGIVTATGDATVLIVGAASTSAAGTVIGSGGATATITGSSTTSAAGAVTGSGSATATITGAAATSAAGTITATGGATATITGASATWAAGHITATGGGNATATIIGAAATSAAGTVTGSGGATVAITGAATASAAGTITATGTSGNAVAYLVGAAIAAVAGTVTATGTRTTIEVNVTEDMICKAVRDYIKSVAVPTMAVRRTPINRASMPKDAYVAFTPGARRPLSTNISSIDTNARYVKRSEQMTFQIDCYGVGSSDLSETLNVLFRDPFAVDKFAAEGFEIAPLYAGDVMQAPFVNDADQYEDRYTFTVELQINSQVTVPQDSCNILGIDLISVDANFPPT